MTRARDLADLGGSANAGTITGDNLIINGDMVVNQRGDSTGKTTSGYYACDRFRLLINTLGTWSIAQNTSAPDGFAYSQRYDCTTADASPATGDYMIVETRLEGQDLQRLDWGTSSAKKITLSFWVKSNKTGTYVVEMSHAGATLPYNPLQYTIDSADTWEYKTLTFSGDTSDSTVNSNAVGLYVNWWIGAGTSFTSGTHTADTWHATSANRAAGLSVNMADSTDNDWSITGVKLEVGSTATPFKHESYAENLNKCHRYYVKRYPGDQTVIATAIAYGAGGAYCELDFPVEMRAVPSVTFTSTASHWEFRNRGTADRTNSGAPSGTSPSKWNCRIDMALASNTTDGAVGWIEANNASAYYTVDAEL